MLVFLLSLDVDVPDCIVVWLLYVDGYECSDLNMKYVPLFIPILLQKRLSYNIINDSHFL